MSILEDGNNKDVFVAAVESGESLQRISSRFGVSRECIRLWIHDCGMHGKWKNARARARGLSVQKSAMKKVENRKRGIGKAMRVVMEEAVKKGYSVDVMYSGGRVQVEGANLYVHTSRGFFRGTGLCEDHPGYLRLGFSAKGLHVVITPLGRVFMTHGGEKGTQYIRADKLEFDKWPSKRELKLVRDGSYVPIAGGSPVPEQKKRRSTLIIDIQNDVARAISGIIENHDEVAGTIVDMVSAKGAMPPDELRSTALEQAFKEVSKAVMQHLQA